MVISAELEEKEEVKERTAYGFENTRTTMEFNKSTDEDKKENISSRPNPPQDHNSNEEKPWIESVWMTNNIGPKNNGGTTQGDDNDDDAEPDVATEWFADPDPLDTFSFQWKLPTTDLNNNNENKIKNSKSISTTIEVTLTGYKAELGQTLHSTGLTLWRASNILCDFLVQQREHIVGSSRNILELGAGLGMCGIVASKLGSGRVILTDGDTDTLARMRDNVQANCCCHKNLGYDDDTVADAGVRKIVECHQLIWGERVEEFRTAHGTFDLILGSDIIYVEEILEPLWNTIDQLLLHDDKDWKMKRKAEFWLAYARRNVSIDLVFQHATKRGFQWKTTNEDGEGVYIFSRL